MLGTPGTGMGSKSELFEFARLPGEVELLSDWLAAVEIHNIAKAMIKNRLDNLFGMVSSYVDQDKRSLRKF
jgi:hypothetical protein